MSNLSLPSDPTTLVALGALVLVVLWAFWPVGKRSTTVAKTSPNEPVRRPGRALLDAVDEAGKDRAAEIIEDKLGRQKAKEVVKGLQAAFEEEAAGSPASPPAASA